MMKGEVKALTQLGQLNELVERTARAMETRLHQKHAEGRRGWKKDIDGLMSRFDRAVLNRDYLDAFILAAMLYDFQQRNSQSTTVTNIPHERRRDRE